MQNPTLKVGDKVKILHLAGYDKFWGDLTGSVGEVVYIEDEVIGLDLKDGELPVELYTFNDDRWELVDDSSLPASTTTEQSIIDESQALINALDESIFYNGYNPIKPKAKPVEVLGALIHLLVDKGVLSSKDAERILVKTND